MARKARERDGKSKEGRKGRRELEGRKQRRNAVFYSIPLGLVIVQLVQLGLAEGEAEAETESIREGEEGERGKKKRKRRK